MIGASGTVGIEYMINPDRLLRVDVSWRAHGAVELDASGNMQELALRGDHYDAVLLRLGLEFGR
jgi:outer membrane protein W